MNTVNYRISLDTGKSGIQATLDGFVVGDAQTRRVYATLYEGGRPYPLPELATLTLYCEKPDGTVSYGSCESSGGIITHTFLSSETSAAGEVMCEFRIISPDGTQLLSSPRFRIIVGEALSDDNAIESTNEYSALTQALGKVPEVFVLNYSANNTYDADCLTKLNTIKSADCEAIVFMKAPTGETLPAEIADGKGNAIRITAMSSTTRLVYNMSTATGETLVKSSGNIALSTLVYDEDRMPQCAAVADYVTQRLGAYLQATAAQSAYQTKLTAGEGIAISAEGVVSLTLTDADGEEY